MIRVLHVIKALGRGGAEVLLREGLRVADRQAFDFSYAYLQSRPDDIASELRELGGRVDCLDLNGNISILLGSWQVARHIRERKIDLVHAHLPLAGAVARLASRMAGVPLVYTEHAVLERYNPIVRRLSQLTWVWQERVIAISEDVANSIQTWAKGRVPITSVWNGVNTRSFDPSTINGDWVRTQLGMQVAQPIIGTVVGFRDTPAKRLDVWIQAANSVHRDEPSVRFLLVGDGPLRPRIERMTADLGLRDAVRFVGNQEDVRPYLAAMDVFLVSSAYEGMPIAPLEAMAMEVPIVATDVQGLRNIIEHERTGLLGTFDENVAETLADQVIRLVRSPNLRRSLAAAARRSVEANFSIERMQRELEGVYREVLAEKRPS